MGYGERNNVAKVIGDFAKYKRTAGEMQDFGANPNGCPACGGVERTWTFCTGQDLENPSGHECPYVGRHLHFDCKCSRPWVTRTKDDPENRKAVDTPAELAVLLVKALTHRLAEIGDDPVVTVDATRIAGVRTLRLQVDKGDDDALVLKLVSQ
jgi:hypothetical protein